MEEQALPLIPPCDRETFEKVWRRVMPQQRDDCPFQLYSDMEEEATDLAPVAPAQAMTASVSRYPHPTVQTPVVPSEGDVPCLGEASAIHGPQLQALIDHALGSWQTYHLLARRGQGSGSKALATMACDKRRHAKRLATAYFLISGVRYWPTPNSVLPQRMAYAGALRHCFHRAQRSELLYRAGAEETQDIALQELYLDLAHDESTHTWHLRGMLEQLT